MDVLLLVVGAAVGVAIGWWSSARRTPAPGSVRASPAPASTSPALDALELHPVGVVLADRRGVVTFRNAAARRLQGTHVGVLVDAAIERHLESALAGGGDHEVLELYGPPRTVLEIDALRLDHGAVVFVGDVSERRRMDRVRTDFVANVSHELKTPIGALSVLAETLAGEDDPDTVHRLVERMSGEADRAARVIDDLMELARIALAADEVVRIADVVTSAVERVTELAAQRGIGITSLGAVGRAGVADDAVVIGDRRQLVSAVGNLVENAVKYSEPGGTVHVRTRRDGALIEVAVTDSGVGIPQRDLDRIFERFYRVDRARSRATGGTGLGLSTVRNVARHHGGDVLVTSTEGEGSTFRLRLPAGPTGARGAVADAVGAVERHDEGIA